MIRSRSIPGVLSRATGDGIHAILLIDADGELLGSYGSPPPVVRHSQDDTAGGTIATNTAHNDKNNWPLDAASIGALISEVAGDYRHMGEELLLLDPQYDSQRQSNDGGGVDGQKEGGGQNHEGELQQQQKQDGSSNGGIDGGSTALQQADGEKNGKDKGPDSGTNLKSLVIELDYGVVGVASAGPDFYVIALADATVQHGALAGRLRSLGSKFNDALNC